MMREALIRTGGIAIRIRFLDTPTADAVWHALPIYSSIKDRDGEIRFAARLVAAAESKAKIGMSKGEIAFLPDDRTIAIGHGDTPLCQGTDIGRSVLCNVWARALDDVSQFASVRTGDPIAILAADS